MHWIIQEGFSDYAALVEQLDRFEIPYSMHTVVPFVGELIPEPKLDTNNVICFGSYSLRHAAKKYGWKPGVYDVGDIDFTIQRQHWGDLMLNHDSQIMPIRDLWIERDTFIRPVDDSKALNGRVWTADEFQEWKPKAKDLLWDLVVQASPVKEIWSEYRFWIVDQKIVTLSRYKMGDRVIYNHDVPQAVIATAWKLCMAFPELDIQPRWVPAKAFVLDLCETPDGIKIVEINTINSAGLYAADVQKLVMALDNLG